jgi:hypothetical protein
MEEKEMNGIRRCAPVFAALVLVCGTFAACQSEKNAALKDPPIITSATYQHTLYNGKRQPVEAQTAKDDAPKPLVTYFNSEESLFRNEGGSGEAPSEVGAFFVRIARPAGNGYKQGPDITIEYHIQKALVTIGAEEKQEYVYDGKPKTASASVDPPVELEFAYYPLQDDTQAAESLPEPPIERGTYRVRVSYSGSAAYLGASKDVRLTIK